MIVKKLFSKLAGAKKTGGSNDGKYNNDESQTTTDETSSSRCSLSLEGPESTNDEEITTAVAAKIILSGSLVVPSYHGKEDDIETRFRNYFALFDGRTSIAESMVRHDDAGRVRQVVADLFDESVQEGQMEIAEDLLAKGTIIVVNRIERCRTGRIFYHLRVSTKSNPSVRQHITGFATIHEDEQKVLEVETTMKLIHARGGCCRTKKKKSGCTTQ